MTIKKRRNVPVLALLLAASLLVSGRNASAQSSPYSQLTYGPSANPNFFRSAFGCKVPATPRNIKTSA